SWGSRFSSLPLYLACVSRTLALVGARTQSSLRRTVSGRITSWYFPRLKVSRMRSATPQRKLTIWLWFKSGVPSQTLPRGASDGAMRILFVLGRTNRGVSCVFAPRKDNHDLLPGGIAEP